MGYQLMFKPATKQQALIRVALCGTAGSGKTYSALALASGLGGKIAVLDTEKGSASLYAGRFNFDVLEMNAPYSPEKYIAAIEAAEQLGYSVLIIDSLTHAWAGIGGLLEMHDNVTRASKSGNSYMAWRDVTPLHNKLVDAMLNSKCHIIATMRAKAEYVVEGNKPRKVGLAPVQREGMDYEFTTCFDLSVDHVALASKDRTGLFDGLPINPITEETGRQIVAWLTKPVEQPTPAPAPAPAPDAGDKFLADLVKADAKPQTKRVYAPKSTPMPPRVEYRCNICGIAGQTDSKYCMNDCKHPDGRACMEPVPLQVAKLTKDSKEIKAILGKVSQATKELCVRAEIDFDRLKQLYDEVNGDEYALQDKLDSIATGVAKGGKVDEQPLS